jgi:hypothetical protein
MHAMEEAESRLTSLLSVCEHEMASLEALEDTRLEALLRQALLRGMERFRAELVATLAALRSPPEEDASQRS